MSPEDLSCGTYRLCSEPGSVRDARGFFSVTLITRRAIRHRKPAGFPVSLRQTPSRHPRMRFLCFLASPRSVSSVSIPCEKCDRSQHSSTRWKQNEPARTTGETDDARRALKCHPRFLDLVFSFSVFWVHCGSIC